MLMRSLLGSGAWQADSGFPLQLLKRHFPLSLLQIVGAPSVVRGSGRSDAERYGTIHGRNIWSMHDLAGDEFGIGLRPLEHSCIF